ncbi:MAG: carbohydrate porin [Planctomycetota bacterium]
MDGPTSIRAELIEDATPKASRLKDFFEAGWQEWGAMKQELETEHGLSLGGSYMFLYQGATDSPGEDQAAGGILEIQGLWELAGRGTPNVGTLGFRVDHRHRMTSIPPSDFGFETGYHGLTGTAFSDVGLGVVNLYWHQHLAGDRLQVVAGRVDPTDYFDLYALINFKTHFQNLSFLTDPSIAAPDPGMGVVLGGLLTDNVYVLGGVHDANATITTSGFDSTFNDAEFFKAVEIGWIDSYEQRYTNNVHVTLWHVDPRQDAAAPEGWGAAFSAQTTINERWLPFVRAGYAHGDASLMQATTAAGVGYQADGGDVYGVGLAWGKPADNALRDQYTAELFALFHVTQRLALTPSVQILMDPANSPDEDVIGVFGLRARLSF